MSKFTRKSFPAEVRAGDGGAKLAAMGPLPERPISDPLLRPERGPRDAQGRPVRAPLGNSIRTLLVFALLVVVGVAVWWLRRPDDSAANIGGREWTITDVNGEPATNTAGLVSTFVLDGTGEIRAPLDCNVATGRWAYDEQRSSLSIEWTTQTLMVCPSEWPQTYLPDSGQVSVDGAVMRIETDAGELRAVSLGDHEPADAESVAGGWMSGDQTIEIGRRGRFEVDECHGSWESIADELSMSVRFEELQRDDCELAPLWRDETPVVPVVDGGVVYLRRERSIFPLDRAIVRLDPSP